MHGCSTSRAWTTAASRDVSTSSSVVGDRSSSAHGRARSDSSSCTGCRSSAGSWSTYGFPPERLIIVSRGGVHAWYSGLATRYVDVFSLFSPEEFRSATEEAKKQRRVGAFDAEVVKRIVETHDLGRVELLHPGMMYRLFMPFWREVATATRVERYSEYSRIAAVDDPVPSNLPADYVAARFYFSDCFPDTAANRAFVSSTIDAVSSPWLKASPNRSFARMDQRV